MAGKRRGQFLILPKWSKMTTLRNWRELTSWAVLRVGKRSILDNMVDVSWHLVEMRIFISPAWVLTQEVYSL